uniref:BHLH domain-containing protein n=1 Tax=Heterorhabditis bacteriophora TaxID=37862 RepID=A0A1I7WCP0_HETBA
MAERDSRKSPKNTAIPYQDITSPARYSELYTVRERRIKRAKQILCNEGALDPPRETLTTTAHSVMIKTME